jgi:hypothetical protein
VNAPRHDPDSFDQRAPRGIRVRDDQRGVLERLALAPPRQILQPAVAIPAPPRRTGVADRPCGVNRVHPVDVGPGAVAAIDDNPRERVAAHGGGGYVPAGSREQPLRQTRQAARPRRDVHGRQGVVGKASIDLVTDQVDPDP